MNQEKDQEYREIFLAEALDNYTEINRLLTILEKKYRRCTRSSGFVSNHSYAEGERHWNGL